LICGWG